MVENIHQTGGVGGLFLVVRPIYLGLGERIFLSWPGLQSSSSVTMVAVGGEL